MYENTRVYRCTFLRGSSQNARIRVKTYTNEQPHRTEPDLLNPLVFSIVLNMCENTNDRTCKFPQENSQKARVCAKTQAIQSKNDHPPPRAYYYYYYYYYYCYYYYYNY